MNSDIRGVKLGLGPLLSYYELFAVNGNDE